MTTQKLDSSKYANAVLFFLKYCNNKYLGATKLNKLLYYLDFISYRDKKKNVTGDVYIHLDYGPVPEQIDLMLSSLKAAGSINIITSEYKDGVTFTYRATKDPDLSIFDKYEQELLKKICVEFELWNTDKIVEQTHLEAPWFYSKPYEKVDYSYAKDIEFFSK